jgi:hypothetical protein
MTEDLLTKYAMDEDLLTRIQRETHERLCELRGAVEEHARLQADLSALDTAPEPLADLELTTALKAAPELPVVSKPPVALDTDTDSELSLAPRAVPEPPAAPESSANVVRLPVRSCLPRTRMVSPKVARLMRAPRRPALERADVVRVGAGRLDPSTEEPVDAEAEVC